MAITQYQDLAGPVHLPPKPLSWAPTYADFARAGTLPTAVVASGKFDTYRTLPNAFTPRGTATYPDTIDRLPIIANRLNGATVPPPTIGTAVYGDVQAAQVMPAPVIQYRANTAPLPSPSTFVAYGGIQAAQIIPGQQRQYKALTLPVVTTTQTVDTYGWRGDWPDWLPTQRPIEFPAFTTGMTSSMVPLRDPVAWKSSWPDWLPVPPRVAFFQYLALDVFPRPGVPSLSWQPEFADWIARKVIVLEGQSVRADVQTAIPVIESWLSEWADFARGPQQPTSAPTTFTTPDANVRTPLTWQPTFADFARAAARVLEGMYARADVQTAIPVIESWLTEFPDFARGRQPLVQEGQYVRADVQTAIPVIESWLSEWADFARGPAQPTAAPTTFTTPDANVRTPLTWGPRYVDRAPGFRTAIETFPSLALNPFPISITTDQMGWRGRYPDWLQLLRPTEFPAFTTGSMQPSIPLPRPLVWLGVYPERARGFQPLTDWQTLAFNPFPITLTTDRFAWRGVAPDWLPVQRPVEYPAFTTGLTASSIPLVRPLIWLGKWADRVPGKAPLTDWQTLALNPFPLTISTDQMGWHGYQPPWLPLLRPTEYPAFTTGVTSSVVPTPRPLVWLSRYDDFARTAPRVADFPAVAFVESSGTFVPVLSWNGVYPEMTRVRPPETHRSYSFVEPSGVFVPPLAWGAEYPDFALAARLPVADMPATVLGLSSGVFVPAGSWRGTYADTAPGQQFLTDLQQAFASVNRIILNVAPLSWKAVYADTVDRKVLPTADVPTFAEITPSPFNVPSLSWRAKYDDFARDLKLPVAAMPFDAKEPNKEAFVVVTPNSWTPRYADMAPGRQPINVGPALSFLRLVVFGPAIVCFQNELILLPTMDPESWTAPYVYPESSTLIDGFVTDESISTPGMTNETISMAAFTDEVAEVC